MPFPAPQSLLRPVRCPACGRPAREFSPCPWCGERAPAHPATRRDAVLAGLGLSLAVLADMADLPHNATIPSVSSFLCGIALFLPFRPSRLPAAGASLVAGFTALALALLSVPVPTPGADALARAFPLAAAAFVLLRVPAEAPNASGSVRERLLRRLVPDVAAAVLLAAFAPLLGPKPIALFGFALVLGVLLSRLDSKILPALFAFAFSLLLPDPSAFAVGLCVAAARSICYNPAP